MLYTYHQVLHKHGIVAHYEIRMVSFPLLICAHQHTATDSIIDIYHLYTDQLIN